ncbi:MAG: hypothetical protein JWM47_3987 [Acidimicrobiales bacterium]|nr:hypothetical protein [Acidimicrobiales bacterium]
MAASRSRSGSPLGLLVGLLLVLALVAAACTSGSDAGTPSTTTGRSSGGPTTSTTTPDGGTGSEDGSPVHDGVRIAVLSSQPDRVSGSETRIRVTPAEGGAVDELAVTLGGADVTGQLTERDGHLEGVVTGLVEGNNTLTATSPGGQVTQRIRAWPVAGPMVSGPHLPLLACATEEAGLGAPADADCSAARKVAWRYLAEDGRSKPLESASARPVDLATATVDGRSVPAIVRYERGVINRSVYEIASLDPTPGGADGDQHDAAWNHRLVYRYGDGCGTTFGQGAPAVTALDAAYLTRGYAVATASFNTGAVQCNDVLSAETTMMVQERFIEAFGEAEATIGEGTGMGAAQAHLIAQNYPGLLDGIVALAPFPDIVSVLGGVTDCGLLNAYYRTPAGKALTSAQRAAVNGHATSATCDQWEAGYGGLLDPTDGCDPKIAAGQIYDPTLNPGGLRCDLSSANVNQFGRVEGTRGAERPLDNIGIQYGLEALNAGAITFDQFIALNAAVGGYDEDGTIQAAREEGTEQAVTGAYENGRISSGVGDQRKIPIIEVNPYTDPDGDIHDRFRAFSLRDRFGRGADAETSPGLQIWTRDPADPTAGGLGPEALVTVDRWLTAILDDTAGGDRIEVLARARPADAVDGCRAKGSTKAEAKVGIYDARGPCRDDHPIAGDPRIASGAPRTDDVIKCMLKPIDATDYPGIELTETRLSDLVATFPQGVCDWRQGGAGQTTPSMTDRSYGDEEDPNNPALLP